MDINRIIACDRAYYEFMCRIDEDEHIIRYRDDEIPDMHSHNFTRIKSFTGISELYSIIDEEIAINTSENKDSCHILIDGLLNEDALEGFHYSPEVSELGIYATEKLEELSLMGNDNCEISLVRTMEDIAEKASLDIEEYGAVWGEDFYHRKGERMGRLYCMQGGIESYICRVGGIVVGCCEVFMNKGVIMFEDFLVSTKHRGKGYGSAIMRQAVNDALAAGVDLMYLSADEEDTPKEMYEKLGFRKAYELTELSFKL